MRILELSAVAVLVALPGVLFLACSSSELTPQATADAGDAGPATDAETADGDGGVDAEQPPDIYPAQHQPIPQLDFLGGPILDHMKLITVTFAKSAGDGGVGDAGGADGGDAGASGGCTPAPLGDPSCQALRTFDDFIVKSDWWHQTMTGYKVSDGTSGGYRELPDTVSNTALSDFDIQQMIVDAVGNGSLPTPDAQTLYALYFPASTQISLGGSASCVEFLGYHNSVFIGQVDAAYAVMPLCKAADAVKTREQLTVTASHEFAEAASDPHPGHDPAYYLATNDAWSATIGASNAGGENGDVCIYAPNYNESGYKVQPIWSNQAAIESRDPCQPAPGIYYGAAVRTTLQTVNKHKSQGYLILNKGESQDAMIDVFSEKALPHDLKIFAGRNNDGSGDPTDMQEIQNGITAKFSRTEVHNGNAVVMTVTVPETAVGGGKNYKFLVRTVLEQNDFHDWPVIVHVN